MPKKSCITLFYDTQEIMKISIIVLVFVCALQLFSLFFVVALFPGKNSKMYEKEMENGVT
jgi:hypothetical protein